MRVCATTALLATLSCAVERIPCIMPSGCRSAKWRRVALVALAPSVFSPMTRRLAKDDLLALVKETTEASITEIITAMELGDQHTTFATTFVPTCFVIETQEIETSIMSKMGAVSNVAKFRRVQTQLQPKKFAKLAICRDQKGCSFSLAFQEASTFTSVASTYDDAMAIGVPHVLLHNRCPSSHVH